MAHGVLTFLFTDIEGSTRRWAQGEEMAALLAQHDQIVYGTTVGHDGRIVKHTGDGVFAAFESAHGAVAAAVAIQREVAGLLLDSEPVRVRMGLHAGAAIDRDGDLFGLDVTTAARIMSAAHGGQIVASDPVRALSESMNTVQFVPLGLHRLKDLAEPRELFQVSAAGLDARFPPLRTLEAIQHNLPVQLTSFIGREEDVQEVGDLLGDHRLVTLTGVGGTGKTRLALQVSAEFADRFADGVRFVELASVTDADDIPGAVASVLGIRHEPGRPDAIRDRVIDRLRGHQVLLVLDNCEHLLAGVAGLVADILSSAPDVKVLASSREGLGLRGERLWQVTSLRVRNDPESEAVRLFLDRAQAVAPKLAWNQVTSAHIVRICELLDGIPLAIELAAARARVLSPAQIAARLDDRFRLLTGGSRAAVPRHQTLEATVDWSYRLLTESERRLFERLSVFVGGFTLEAAEQVGAGDDIEPGEILDLLTGLVDRSMVLADQGPSGVSRYRMLETLRAFGFQRLSDSDTVEVWKDRHLAYFAGWLEGVDVLGWSVTESAKELVGERANLAAALDWALQRGADHVSDLASALAVDRYVSLGAPEEALKMIELAVNSAGSGAGLRVRAMHARIVHALGRAAEFHSLASDIAATADDVGAADGAWSLAAIGTVYASDPELDSSQGITLAQRAVDRSEGLSDHLRFRAWHSLAFASLWVGRPEQMARVVATAVDIGRKLEPAAIIDALSTLVIAAMTIDQRDGTDMTSAVEDELRQVWERTDRRVFSAYLLWAGIRRGWWDLVEEELDRLLPEQHGIVKRSGLMPLAVLRMMRGDLAGADEAFEHVSALGPIHRWHHDYYPTRAEIAAWRGDLESVERWVDEHRSVPVADSERILRLAGLRALVRARVDAGDRRAAEDALDEMRRIHAEGSAMPAVQLGSPAFYLRSAEAEFTRMTTPDPGLWGEAEELAAWIYWKQYCRVRALEARHRLGEEVSREAAELRTALRDLGARGLLDLLDHST
jgi:predicted ATPase/class 3 adenylate cyclase